MKFVAGSKKEAVRKAKQFNREHVDKKVKLSSIALTKTAPPPSRKGKKVYHARSKYYPEKDTDWG